MKAVFLKNIQFQLHALHYETNMHVTFQLLHRERDTLGKRFPFNSRSEPAIFFCSNVSLPTLIRDLISVTT
jgi:hypothetical protein